MKKELGKIREEIDVLDKEIVSLLEKRMGLAKKVAEIKEKEGILVYDEKREKIVIDKIKENLKNKELEEYIEKIYINIMQESKRYQRVLIKK